MNVAIRTTGGPYASPTPWIGPLADAPVTAIIPEGIVSGRTDEEARELRAAIGEILLNPKIDRVVITAIGWQIVVVKDPLGPTGAPTPPIAGPEGA